MLPLLIGIEHGRELLFSVHHYNFLCFEKFWDCFNLLHSSLVPRAVSLAISGTPENHHKLRILCLSKMKAVWDTQVGKGFPFSDLAHRRYVGAGGRLDRHGAVPYEPYIALLGKFPFFFF